MSVIEHSKWCQHSILWFLEFQEWKWEWITCCPFFYYTTIKNCAGFVVKSSGCSHTHLTSSLSFMSILIFTMISPLHWLPCRCGSLSTLLHHLVINTWIICLRYCSMWIHFQYVCLIVSRIPLSNGFSYLSPGAWCHTTWPPWLCLNQWPLGSGSL